MVTKERYEFLKKKHEDACKINDYSNMIMLGDKEDIELQEYFGHNICTHWNVEKIKGVEICRSCKRECK